MSNETITLVKDTSHLRVGPSTTCCAARGIVQRDFTTTPFIVAAAFYLDDPGAHLGLSASGETLCLSTTNERACAAAASQPMIEAMGHPQNL